MPADLARRGVTNSSPDGRCSNDTEFISAVKSYYYFTRNLPLILDEPFLKLPCKLVVEI